MSLEENISHCFREYPKMKLRIEILEAENQRLQAEVARTKRTATEAALRWAANDIQTHDHPVAIWDAWIRSGLAALLGEK